MSGHAPQSPKKENDVTAEPTVTVATPTPAVKATDAEGKAAFAQKMKELNVPTIMPASTTAFLEAKAQAEHAAFVKTGLHVFANTTLGMSHADLTLNLVDEFTTKLSNLAVNRPAAIAAIEALQASFAECHAKLKKEEINTPAYIKACQEALEKQQDVLSQPHTFGEKLYKLIADAVQSLMNLFNRFYNMASGSKDSTKSTSLFNAATPLSKEVAAFRAGLESIASDVAKAPADDNAPSYDSAAYEAELAAYVAKETETEANKTKQAKSAPLSMFAAPAVAAPVLAAPTEEEAAEETPALNM